MAIPGKREEHRQRHHSTDKARVRWQELTPEQREAKRARDRQRARANPQREYERQRRWRESHPEAVAESKRRWREANPEKARAQRLRNRLRRLAIPPPSETALERLSEIVFLPCVYCNAAMTHVDHLVPISNRRLQEGVSGGDNSAENLFPACGPCNRRKHDWPLATFLRREERRRASIQGERAARQWFERMQKQFKTELTWPGCDEGSQDIANANMVVGSSLKRQGC